MLGTKASHPHVVYVDSKYHRLPEFEFRRTPGGACRITAGGRVDAGVNALLEAVITYAGMSWGTTWVLSWVSVWCEHQRWLPRRGVDGVPDAHPGGLDSGVHVGAAAVACGATELGHKLETACTGVTQAYTPSGLMDLRKRRPKPMTPLWLQRRRRVAVSDRRSRAGSLVAR